MEKLNNILEKLTKGLKKQKYAILILLLGVGQLLLPDWSKEEPAEAQACEEDRDMVYVHEMEQRLNELLSMCSGAGQVQVMLTLEKGSQTEYQTDVQISAESDRNSEDRKTVILSEGSAYDKAAVSAVSYPRFQGALILCEGAENPEVQLKLVRAVASLTGLGTNQITVIKMK